MRKKEIIETRPVLCQAERALPLCKYYDMPLYALGPRESELLERGCPADPAKAIPAQNWLDLLHPTGYTDLEYGYCKMPDGTAYVAVYTVYPRCTPSMLAWYFRWMNTPCKSQPLGKDGYDNIRYKIWNPADHVGHGFVNGKNKEGGIWTVESLDLGAGEEKTYTVRHSIDLRQFGLSEEREQELKAAGCFVDAAWETFHTMDAEHRQLPGMHLCLTLSRKSPLGYMEKCTREWIGYGVRDGKIVKDETTPAYMFSDEYLKKVVTHSTVEAQQLSVFLADLYEEYHDKPEDAD